LGARGTAAARLASPARRIEKVLQRIMVLVVVIFLKEIEKVARLTTNLTPRERVVREKLAVSLYCTWQLSTR
jgi:hypothetical protein